MSEAPGLSRDQILAHVDTRLAAVDVPELGGTVYVGSLTVEEADKIRSLGEDGVPASVRIAILATCDAQGTRLFTEEDAVALKKVAASAIGKIANKALEHNGLTETAREEVKNGSSATAGDDSVSA